MARISPPTTTRENNKAFINPGKGLAGAQVDSNLTVKPVLPAGRSESDGWKFNVTGGGMVSSMRRVRYGGMLGMAVVEGWVVPLYTPLLPVIMLRAGKVDRCMHQAGTATTTTTLVW